MHESSTPLRPHQKLTSDGRRMAEVLSYSRRGSRFTPSEAEAWAARGTQWVVPDEAVDDPGFSWASWFGREAPMIVEVGSGVGEATAALAATRAAYDVVALEVWRPGVAATLGRLVEVGATNVRLCGVDAVWSMAHLFEPRSLQEVWTFFPDPWPKTKHRKRRIVTPAFAASVATRLVPGGTWRLATDWAAYAEVMRGVLDAEPGLRGGVVERWAERPVTKFERKGQEAGRAPTDLAYVAR